VWCGVGWQQYKSDWLLDPRTWERLGQFYLQRRDYFLALDAFDQCVKLATHPQLGAYLKPATFVQPQQESYASCFSTISSVDGRRVPLPRPKKVAERSDWHNQRPKFLRRSTKKKKKKKEERLVPQLVAAAVKGSAGASTPEKVAGAKLSPPSSSSSNSKYLAFGSGHGHHRFLVQHGTSMRPHTRPQYLAQLSAVQRLVGQSVEAVISLKRALALDPWHRPFRQYCVKQFPDAFGMCQGRSMVVPLL
jgi:hypothetical protein